MDESNLVYTLDGKIYINLTNLCTNDCIFCIRSQKNDVQGTNLILNDEKFTADDVIAQLKTFEDKMSSEIVFCGYGEPTIKLDIMKQVAKFIKETYPNVKVRLNTNGQGNMIHKRNIAPELKGLIDEISVSLNADNETLYDELSRPNANFQGAYSRVKEFIWYCAEEGIKTVATVVVGYKDYKIDVEKCKMIAKNLGADFRIRKWIENGY